MTSAFILVWGLSAGRWGLLLPCIVRFVWAAVAQQLRQGTLSVTLGKLGLNCCDTCMSYCQCQVGHLAKNVNCLNKGVSCRYMHQNLPIRGWKIKECRAGCSSSFLRPLGPDMSICGAWSHSLFWMVTHLSMNWTACRVTLLMCVCNVQYVVFTQNYMKVPLLELHESSFISTGVQ